MKNEDDSDLALEVISLLFTGLKDFNKSKGPAYDVGVSNKYKIMNLLFIFH